MSPKVSRLCNEHHDDTLSWQPIKWPCKERVLASDTGLVLGRGSDEMAKIEIDTTCRSRKYTKDVSLIQKRAHGVLWR